MRELPTTGSGTQNHRAHRAETRDRVIYHDLRATGKALTPDVGHEFASAGDGGRRQSKNAPRGSLGEIDGQASDVGSEGVWTEGGNGREESLVIEEAGIAEARHGENGAAGAVALLG